jgi:hypothetical protein
MNIFTFPTKFIYWEKIKSHKKIKDKYHSIILEHKEKYGDYCKDLVKSKWNCNCYSSFFMRNNDLHIKFEDDFLTEVIWNVFDKMFYDLNNSILKLPVPKSSYIVDMWYNYYTKGMFQEIHNHESNEKTIHYSGIYLLDLHETNTTNFVDNTFSGFSEFKTNNMEEGNVIIFPSELLHYANPCLSDRITVSFNIASKY